MRSDISAGLGVEGLCSLSWPGPWASLPAPMVVFFVAGRMVRGTCSRCQRSTAGTDRWLRLAHFPLVLVWDPGGTFFTGPWPLLAATFSLQCLCGEVASLVRWGQIELVYIAIGSKCCPLLGVVSSDPRTSFLTWAAAQVGGLREFR